MSQPVYFLPNVSAAQLCNVTGDKALNRKVLQAHGLLLTFGDVCGEACTITAAKVKAIGEGCLLACGAPDKATRPDELTWHEGKAWIGYDPENPPTEAELSRKRKVGGYNLEADDGSKWVIPIIRRPDDSTELPCDMYYVDGAMKEPVKDAYLSFWEETAEVCQWFFNDSGEFGGPGFSKLRAFDLAVKALGINYRYGQQEQRVCKVVNSENFLTVLSFTVDFPRYVAVSAAEKKSESQLTTPNTTPGPGAGSEATDPAGQTSI